MKNHHLFLLVVSLLLAASFVFPTTPLSLSTPPTPPAPTEHSIRMINDSNDMPATLLTNDVLKIKVKQDELSSVQNNTVSHLELLAKDPATAAEINLLKEKAIPIEEIQTGSDEVPQKYHVVTLPDKPGNYRLTYIKTPTYGMFKLTNSPLAQVQNKVSHDITLLASTPSTREKITVNGDDGV